MSNCQPSFKRLTPGPSPHRLLALVLRVPPLEGAHCALAHQLAAVGSGVADPADLLRVVGAQRVQRLRDRGLEGHLAVGGVGLREQDDALKTFLS